MRCVSAVYVCRVPVCALWTVCGDTLWAVCDVLVSRCLCAQRQRQLSQRQFVHVRLASR